MDSLVRKARDLAVEFHRGQRRKHGQRQYIYHPATVVKYLRSKGYLEEVLLAAGWCHDLLEDTPLTRYNMETELGPYVTGLVLEVSQPISKQGLSRSDRWPIYLEHYERASHFGKVLKLADRRCNLKEYVDYWREITPKEKSFLDNVYLYETGDLVDSLYSADSNIADDVVFLSNEIDELLRTPF